MAIDVSGSLTENATAATAAVNQLAELMYGGNDPVARHCWFSVVQFATDAHELLRMCRLRAGQALPDVRYGGVTNFGPLFTLLTTLIRRDLAHLHHEGYAVFRPAVLILTDGQASDDWTGEFIQLTEYDTAAGVGFSYYPFVLPIGIGIADHDLLATMHHPPFIRRHRPSTTAATDITSALVALLDILDLCPIAVDDLNSFLTAPVSPQDDDFV
ncbi:vWA domain-containing protein [Amycolatopsis lexingtonensis]|uniref:vWA domain-containing protein n=1 Tax=Amycolatopsis lexingtonensis TaxID=218822 RepID=UPI003F72C568